MMAFNELRRKREMADVREEEDTENITGSSRQRRVGKTAGNSHILHYLQLHHPRRKPLRRIKLTNQPGSKEDNQATLLGW